MRNPKDNKNKRLLKMGLGFCLPVLAIALGFSALATGELTSESVWDIPYSAVGNTPLTYDSNISVISGGNFALNSSENYDYISLAAYEAQQAAAKQSNECSDVTNKNGLGAVHKEHMENERKKDLATVNLDNIFQAGKKGGCFYALSDFPDLSVMIPSITSIANSVKDTLVKYATRKVCLVVDEALESALGPVKDALEEISERGQLDLSGRVNKEMTERLYGVDAELGRLSVPSQAAKEIEFKW